MDVGIVGYGASGRAIHTPLIKESGNRVTDVVTSHDSRRAAALADWPAARVHADLAGLLESARPDVLVIASPSARHAENAMAAITAGVPAVIDKPIALDRETAEQVVRHAEAMRTPLTVFQNRRWDSEQLTLRRLLDQQVLGAVHRFERRWERWRPVPKAGWRVSGEPGGGLLLDLGVHLVDSAIDLFGPATSVYAELREITTPTEDDVFLALHHRSGTISHLSAGTLVGAPGPRTRVLGSAAAYLVTVYPEDDQLTPFDTIDPGPGMEGILVRGGTSEPVPRAPGSGAGRAQHVLGTLLVLLGLELRAADLVRERAAGRVLFATDDVRA